MFEKEAEEAIMKKYPSNITGYKNHIIDWQDGAEYGYNKANEWQYVSEKGTPQKKVRIKDIYAWKEIVPPQIKED